MRCSTRAQELFGALRAGDARRARALLDGDNREELLDEVDSEAFLKDLRLAPIALALLDLFLGPGSPVLDATVRLSLRAPQDALFHAVMRHAPKNAEIGNVLAANAIGSAAGAQFVERALAGLDQVIAQKGVGAYARMLAIHPRLNHLFLQPRHK